MTDRQISVIDPLQPAWERMTTMLFRPFDPVKWLIVGFSAWLAGLSGGGGNFGFQFPGGGGSGSAAGREEVGEALSAVLERLLTSWWVLLVAVGCVLLVAVALAVLWVSSRGKFVFLDNVLRDRAELVEPWRRTERLGNSLFFFQVGLIASVLLLAGLGTSAFLLLMGGLEALQEAGGPPPLALVGAGVLGMLLLAVAVAFTIYFLNGFVVPLMLRYNLGVVEGWKRFFVLFRSHPAPFVLSGLLVLVLGIGVFVLVVTAGLMTCCIGFILLIIPYVGTVLLLPVPVFYRAYTVELLARVDPGLLGTTEGA